jgi:oxygen-independent coproporphyrinogen-3 oxidase
MARLDAAPRLPLSIYIHVPFCDTLCHFCACNAVVSNRRATIDDYCRDLEREIGHATGRLGAPPREVIQVALGGGSPSHAGPENLRQILACLREYVDLRADAEVSIEVDPRDMTEAHADAIIESGCTRVSLGIQDLDPEVQQAINRVQPFEQTRQVIGWLRGRGDVGINVDIVYGLPRQTGAGLERTLDGVLELDPDRVASFGYAHVPWMKPHQKLIREEDLPTPDQRLAMLVQIIERLTNSGMVFIGMDHFARADDDLATALAAGTLQRNFQGYSTHAGTELLAFGVSGISHIRDAYFQNCKDLRGYRAAVAAGRPPVERGVILTAEDCVRRAVIMDLMCRFRLDFSTIERDHGVDVPSAFAGELRALEPLIADGLVERTSAGLAVTEPGRLFVRNIAMVFDQYLPGTSADSRPHHSHTV